MAGKMQLHAPQGIKRIAVQMRSEQTVVWMYSQAREMSGQKAG